MSRTTLLFDLDGTLTNPAPGFIASVRYALNELGVDAPDDSQLCQFIGPPLRETMGWLLGTQDPARIEEAVELYRWRLDNGGKFEAEVFPHIPETLAHFADKGHALYICTGKPQGVASQIVENFGLAPYFDKVYGAQLDGQHGDKAELIAHIWESEQIESTAGVMVGDTSFDIMGARANSLKTVAVAWGFGDDQELLALAPDRFVSNQLDLIAAIESCC